MDNNFYQQLVAEESALEKQLNELRQTLDHVRGLKNHYEDKAVYKKAVINTPPVERKKVGRPKKIFLINKEDYPTEFDKELTQHQKSYAIVYNLESATSNEIADELIKLDPSGFSEKKALRVARETSSDLHLKGIFGSKKVGKKNRYFIKQKATV